jgi:hypothetical protein
MPGQKYSLAKFAVFQSFCITNGKLIISLIICLIITYTDRQSEEIMLLFLEHESEPRRFTSLDEGDAILDGT